MVDNKKDNTPNSGTNPTHNPTINPTLSNKLTNPINPTNPTEDKKIYARALQRFRDEFLILQKGKVFSYDDVVRYFQLDRKPNAQEAKHAMSQVLYNLTHRNKDNELEMVSKRNYRMVDRTLNEIEWWEASEERGHLPIVWPYGVDDQTDFGFDKDIVIYPGDVIGLAGETNRGKTALALNFMLNNLETFPKSIYFTSEFTSKDKFRDRMQYFTWIDYRNGNGKPKFQLAKHEENFQDVIIPAGQNIVDWVDMPDEPWKIGQIFKKVSEALNGEGVAFICLQKRDYKNMPVGGGAALDYASAFFTVYWDKERNSNVLRVDKVKTPGESNPNFRKFSFGISKGSKLFAIQKLE